MAINRVIFLSDLKIPWKSISEVPMECLEGKRKFLHIRINTCILNFSKMDFLFVIF